MDNKIKICAISDTHNQLFKIKIDESPDVLIHSGDFSTNGSETELKRFLIHISEIPIKQKICVLGNHDYKLLEKYKEKELRRLFNNFNVTLLINESITLNHITIHGISWHEDFWYKTRPELESIYSFIDLNANLLVTHHPPYKILDLSFKFKSEYCGCPIIEEYINKMPNLSHHFFGHIHESYGVLKKNNITFHNTAILDENYLIKNQPVYLEV